jgi:hypothetical protein
MLVTAPLSVGDDIKLFSSTYITKLQRNNHCSLLRLKKFIKFVHLFLICPSYCSADSANAEKSDLV